MRSLVFARAVADKLGRRRRRRRRQRARDEERKKELLTDGEYGIEGVFSFLLRRLLLLAAIIDLATVGLLLRLRLLMLLLVSCGR